jgi:hypothetical protein
MSLKLIFFGILPIIMLAGSAIFWGVLAIAKKNFYDYKIKVVSSTLVIFFIMHPSIARVYFSFLDCVSVGDT